MWAYAVRTGRVRVSGSSRGVERVFTGHVQSEGVTRPHAREPTGGRGVARCEADATLVAWQRPQALLGCGLRRQT